MRRYLSTVLKALPAATILLAALIVNAPAQLPVECYSVHHTQTPYPFNQVFDLWLSPTMVDSANGGWTQADIDSFCLNLIDADPDNSDDIFPLIWNYYCHGDSAAAYDSVFFQTGKKPFDRIRTDLYFQEDCCINTCDDGGCPGTWSKTCRQGGWIECGGFGVYRGENRFSTAGGLCPDEVPFRPWQVARSPVWSHELSHLCDKANKQFIDPANSEMLATGAEYLAGERWNHWPDIPRSTEYDVSLMTGNPNNHSCGGNETRCKYNQYRLFNAYLFEHFSGEADSLDLVYRWLRYQENGKYITTFRGLGHVITEEPFADRIPGVGPHEKMGALYHRYAIARYVDEPVAFEGIFGFGEEVSPRFMRFFEWPDTVAMPRSKVIPPVIQVGVDTMGSMSEWRDPVQPWAGAEPLRVLTTGTDYLLFVADSTLSSTESRTLRIQIRGTEPIPENQSFRIGYAAYDTAAVPLYDHVPVQMVENVDLPHVLPEDTLDMVFTIPDFGAGTRGAVVVFSMVQEELQKSFWGVMNMDYEISYRLE